jgi:DNA-binding NarL/FixJ family response regulator
MPSDPVRTLIVEDSPPFRRGLEKLLASRPEVEWVGSAGDGEEGLRLARSLRPQVVLLDLELPGMDGIEVTRRLKSGDSPEVLILTTFDEEEKVYEAVRAGASGYLVKRIAGEGIVAAILDVHRGGSVIESRIARRFWNHFAASRGKGAGGDPFGLTPEEREVLHAAARGLSTPEVGRALEIGGRAVKGHLERIYAKMGVSNRVEAVVKALGAGVIEL